MHVAFVFLDGVGLGAAAPTNPLSTCSLPAFEHLAGNQAWTEDAKPLEDAHHVFRPIDATLGVEGLPQSGTGQTALFTGINAAALAGRHYGPFPHSRTYALLAEHNLFTRLQGQRVSFLNAYPDRFFSFNEQTGRWSTTTRMCREAGVPLCTIADLEKGHALAADLTGDGLRDGLGLSLSPLTPVQAGHRLHALAQRHDCTLFEYFLTDKAGHGRGLRTAASVLSDLDAFFAGYLARFDPAQDLLLITSDHGNLEDVSIKSHTRNPVPLVAYGRGAAAFAGAHSLLDVTPALVKLVLGQ